MRGAALALLMTVATGSVAQGENPVQPAAMPIAARLPSPDVARAKLAAEMTALERDGFSGVAAVEVGGQLIWSGAAGLADPKRAIRFTPDTQMPIGSLVKSFTAAA